MKDKELWGIVFLALASSIFNYELGHYRGQHGADHWYAEHEPRVQIISTPERIVSQQLKIEAGPATECKLESNDTDSFKMRCYHVESEQSKIGWPAQTPIIPAGSNGSHGDLVPVPVVQ